MPSKVLPQPSSASFPQPRPFVALLRHKLSGLGDALVQLLFVAPQDALSVQKREYKGQTVWIVRDRMSQTRQKFTNEEALLIWLEKRYHR